MTEDKCCCGHDHDCEEKEFEVQLITLINENGDEEQFEVLDMFGVEGKEYVAICRPEGEEDDDEAMLFRLEVDPETKEEMLLEIEDDYDV